MACGKCGDDPKCLVCHEAKRHSQNGEDGIIAEVFRRIGMTNHEFVEFGVEGGLECNTRALLVDGWSGLWIEASPKFAASIRSTYASQLATGRLRLVESFVTAENIEQLLVQGFAAVPPDLLSIDIDGNDYWVWKAIATYRPRAVVIEYNARLGSVKKVAHKYDPSFRWDMQTAAYGASLNALASLGTSKGYSLVACDSKGVNAFFVRDDLLEGKFMEPFTSEKHHRAAWYHQPSKDAPWEEVP